MIDWTGERYLPEVGGQIELEHLHRYMMVLDLAKGKRVLDIASGEGYGSNILSSVAKNVVGVDIAEEAVLHANEKYKHDSMRFVVGSCAAIPLEDNCVDLIVSFETIEHHDEHEKMLEEFLRVLTPEGVIIVSSPDKYEYSDLPDYSNPYHVKELYCEEFERLVGVYFKNIKSLGQRVVYGSMILSDDLDSRFNYQKIADDENKGFRPLYNIVLATNKSENIPCLKSGALEGDIMKAELVCDLRNKLNAAVSERDTAVFERDTSINKNQALSDQLTALYASRSWRLTKPLRWVKFIFTRVRS